jgi:hypothetical protein
VHHPWPWGSRYLYVNTLLPNKGNRRGTYDGKVKPDGRGGREKPDGTPLKPPAGRVGEAPLGNPLGGRVGDPGFGAAFGISSPSSSGPWAATKTLIMS